MRRLSFAAISSNTHPSVDTANFDFSLSLLDTDSFIDSIASSIIKNISSMSDSNTQRGSGEWRWLHNNKQIDYIDAISSFDPSKISPYLANLFRSSATYGFLSPSFTDIADYSLAASDILSNIDSCIEFTGLSTTNELATPLHCGNPYGLVVEEDTRVLPDTPRHFYYATNILRLVEQHTSPIICEIGGGYGGLSYYLHSKCPTITTVNIDLLPALVTTFAYLSLRKIPVRFSEGPHDIHPNYVNLIAANNKFSDNYLAQIKPDLVFNSRSLCEMSRETCFAYINLINNSGAKYFYHENSNFLLFPDSKRHIEILAETFPVSSQIYGLSSMAITPFHGGSGRYREYVYQLKH